MRLSGIDSTPTSILNASYVAIRWVLGGVFICAGIMKLLDPEVFATLINAFGLIPKPLLMPVAIALPVLEVVAGVGMFFDAEGSLSVITGLLLLFVAILGYGIWMGLDVDCGCFGPEDPKAKAFHGLKLSLYRDFIMIAGVFFLYGWRYYNGVTPLKIKEFMKRSF